MWEGFDEWAHFGYVQHVAEHHQIPSRTDHVSSRLQRPLELVPVSRSAAEALRGAVTHEAFWRLHPEERIRRRNELLRLSPQYQVNDASLTARQYEAQQPPLYYVILTPAYLLVKPLSLPSQVLALRIVSLLIASGIVFLGNAVALRTIDSLKSALLCIAILAAFPSLYISVCRVGNDGLAIVLTSAVVLYSLRCCRGDAITGIEGCVILVVACTLMSLPVAYHSVVAFLTQNITNAIGWYLYPVVVPEVVLLVLGFRGIFGPSWSPRALVCVCILTIVLDLYTVHFVLMPYYSGMSAHGPSGSSIGVLARGMAETFRRLSINKPASVGPVAISVMWIGYVCSTATLAGIAFFAAKSELEPSTPARTHSGG